MCYADLQSLRDGDTPTAADAASRYDLSCENAMPGGPQTARHCSIINNSSADDAQSTAEGILNRQTSGCAVPAAFCAAMNSAASSGISSRSSSLPTSTLSGGFLNRISYSTGTIYRVIRVA